MNKKILISSIIAVVILLLPSTIVMSELNTDTAEDIEIQNIINNGLPDLIIEDIFIRFGSMIGDQIFDCTIKNIGDAKTEKNIIETHTTVRYKLFGILPLSIVFSETTLHGVGLGLYPGESATLSIVDDYELPKFGTYSFSCTVNPNKKIGEYTYSNNRYSEGFHVLFGYWF